MHSSFLQNFQDTNLQFGVHAEKTEKQIDSHCTAAQQCRALLMPAEMQFTISLLFKLGKDKLITLCLLGERFALFHI